MIGRLRGRIVADEGDGTLVLDVGGVGYELTAPLGSLGRLDAAAGEVELQVHTHVRDGAIELYAFVTSDERTAFRTLIQIPKVGPKLAMAVLGSLTVDELADCVNQGQLRLLTKVPGVGKKTAERMILELDGKLQPTGGSSVRRHAAPTGQGQVLADALQRMGFKQSEAERAVSSLDDLERPLSDLIRDALAVLSP